MAELHGPMEVSELLKGDRYADSPTWKAFERWMNAEAKKNKRETETPDEQPEQ